MFKHLQWKRALKKVQSGDPKAKEYFFKKLEPPGDDYDSIIVDVIEILLDAELTKYELKRLHNDIEQTLESVENAIENTPKTIKEPDTTELIYPDVNDRPWEVEIPGRIVLNPEYEKLIIKRDKIRSLLEKLTSIEKP